MDTAAYVNTAVEQTSVLADWVHGEDPAAPVPTCPEWTLADLVDHVAGTHRMVTTLVGQQLTDPSPAFAAYTPGPADSTVWRTYLNTTAAATRDAFDSVTDATPVWDPSGAEAGVEFWSRRIFGETSVHRADAAAALGHRYELAPDLAVAALEDWLAVLTSTGYWANVPDFAAAMAGTGQTLHFHATDAAGEWLARRGPDGITLDHAHAAADVTARGPATELLLMISRRRPLADADVQVDGDRALLDHWIAHMDWVGG